MKINTINENKIELYLTDEEVDDIFGGYELIDYNTPECRIKIHSLIISAAPKSLFPLDCERIFIEVRPKGYGCTITLTKEYHSVKKYRKAIRTKISICIFENSEDMLSAVNILKSINANYSELYSRENRYALIIKTNYGIQNGVHNLGEYCIMRNDELTAEKIREYWYPICKECAIEKLSKFF